MVKFVIIRHGYSVSNKERMFAGQMDVKLDELGLSQAEDTAKYILENYKIDAVYSSDLCRAVDTAKPLADALGLPVITYKELREISAGCWEGMYISEVKDKYPEKFAKGANDVGNARCGDGETTAELIERGRKIFQKIARENEGKTVAIATHGGLIRAVRCMWLGISLDDMKDVPHVANASVTEVLYDNETDKAELTVIGYSEHLNNKVTEFSINV